MPRRSAFYRDELFKDEKRNDENSTEGIANSEGGVKISRGFPDSVFPKRRFLFNELNVGVKMAIVIPVFRTMLISCHRA